MSSDKEIITYISSPAVLENMEFVPNGAHAFLYDFPLQNGQYEATFFDPKSDPVRLKVARITKDITKFRTPVFTDDIVVHILKQK